MESLRRFLLPLRLSPRVWLLSLPSALLSFERRQRLPRLPIGRWRYAGLLPIAAGAGLAAWAWRRGEGAAPRDLPLGRFSRRPATLAGLLVLGGAALLLRSLVLAAYSAALALLAGSDAVAVEEPQPDAFLFRRGR